MNTSETPDTKHTSHRPFQSQHERSRLGSIKHPRVPYIHSKGFKGTNSGNVGRGYALRESTRVLRRHVFALRVPCKSICVLFHYIPCPTRIHKRRVREGCGFCQQGQPRCSTLHASMRYATSASRSDPPRQLQRPRAPEGLAHLRICTGTLCDARYERDARDRARQVPLQGDRR